ncbi:MAG: hypothetical protein R2834_12285 [Rhodothermales bacterium]
MNKHSDLERLENSLFASYWSDGLVDVVVGIGILGIGVCWTLDIVAVSAALPAILVPLWLALRTRFTEPRMGVVRFSEKRTNGTREKLGLVAGIGVGVFLLVVTGVFVSNTTIRRDVASEGLLWIIAPGIPSMLIAVALALGGWMIRQMRFVAYVLIVTGLAALGVVFAVEPHLQMTIAGIAILAIGLFHVVRFAQHYPLPDHAG